MDNRWDFGLHQERKVMSISVYNPNKQNQTKLYSDTKLQKILYHGTTIMLYKHRKHIKNKLMPFLN